MLARPTMGRPKPNQLAHISHNPFRPAPSSHFYSSSLDQPLPPLYIPYPPPLLSHGMPHPKSPLYSTKSLGETSKMDQGRQEEQEKVHVRCRGPSPSLPHALGFGGDQCELDFILSCTCWVFRADFGHGIKWISGERSC